ncbi:c-type cytochrome [Sphingomonas sp. PAMC 26617]|uniref:c-type cytochrome n=1 Tax=Sphingomonas sp. PAMC 26617 TaxID=1112216 RepID=UPI00055D7DC5|nr:cytochrome c [Sphingomonas sp. PAMC 26617]
MLKRILFLIVGILAIGTVGFGVFAWRPSLAKVPQPTAASFSPALVRKGEVLASAGYCASCHTVRGGQPYAGGYAMATQFGTIYSTNITPDRKTGIGGWSEAAFERAMRQGVRRDGAHLFPAFPYDHFSKLTDSDVSALYAFMMTRAPVVADERNPTIPWPLNIRALQAGWKLLFFRPGRFAPDATQSVKWNRGAYLAEGVSHCGACHTPRGSLGAEKRDQAYAGAAIDGWIAPSLGKTNSAPVPWSHDELVAYLSTGVSQYHGTAAGPMGAVSRSLSKLPPADVAAIATYFASRNGSAGQEAKATAALRKAAASEGIGLGLQYDPAARLYAGACASCHYNGKALNPLRPDLALNSAVSMDDPTNLIQVILHGVSAADGAPGVVMPGFSGFSDADIARLAAWLRKTRTDKPAWADLQNKVAAIREPGRAQGKGE